jgi:hypothetical protein
MSVAKEIRYAFRDCKSAYAHKDYSNEDSTNINFSFGGDSDTESVDVSVNIGSYDARNLMRALASRFGYECVEKAEEPNED